MALSSEELCARYEQLYPGAVTDILDELGYMHQTLPSSINPLTKGMRVAGIAYPVRGSPDPNADYDENIRRILRMLGEAPAQSVVAYETNDDDAAHLGELSTLALQNGGCRGAVIDGGVRDTRYILEQDFPVFTRYRTPADAPLRWHLEEWNIPVQIGEVEICPGDILIGDFDGMACVPQAVATDVLEQAEEKVKTESQIRDAIEEGRKPINAYEEYGTF